MSPGLCRSEVYGCFVALQGLFVLTLLQFISRMIVCWRQATATDPFIFVTEGCLARLVV